MLRRIVNDASLRSLPLLLPFSLVASVPLTVILSWPLTLALLRFCQLLGFSPPPEREILWLVGLWGPPVLSLLWCCVHRRCLAFELALPLSARRLWLSRLLSVLLATALVTATAILCLVLVRTLLAHGPFVPEMDILAFSLRLGTVVILATVLLAARHLELAFRCPDGPMRTAEMLVLWIAGLGGLLLLQALPLAASLVPLVLAVTVGVASYRALPATFSMLPLAPASEPALSVPPADGALPGAVPVFPTAGRFHTPGRVGTGGFWLLLLTFWRTPYVKGAMPCWVLFLPVLMFFGVLQSGTQGFGLSEADLRLNYALMAWYLPLVFVWPVLHNLKIFSALPVSRRLVLALWTVPVVLMVVAGYALGRLVSSETARAGDEQSFLPLLVLVMLVPWLLEVAILARTFRSDVSKLQRTVCLWSLLAVSLLGFVGMPVADLAGVMEMEEPTARLHMLASQLTAQEPGRTLLLWGFVLAAVALAYRFASQQFNRLDAVSPDISKVVSALGDRG